MSSSEFFAELTRAVPADALIRRESEMAVYECDGLTMFRQTPLAVVLPADVGEVCAVLRCCKKYGVPAVARGAGTGLSGGALPLKDGVLLTLAKMNKILSIDAEARLARVQPGVANLAVSAAAARYGLYYAPDPSSQQACSIGGNIAENAGGVHCLKYGLTVNNVRQITIVTIDGDVVSLGAASPDFAGYDLTALFNGSEGMLGVVVEATVQLLPRPPAAEVALAAFAAVSDAADAVAAIIAAGVIPAGLEMMDNPAICATENFVRAGYPREAAAVLICELDGHPCEVEAELARVLDIFNRHRATKITVAQDDEQRQKLWAGRKAAFPAVGRISPDYYCMDGAIPRRRVGEVLKAIGEMSRQYRLPVANVFHAGDGNLHPLIMYDANKEDSARRAERFGDAISRLCVEAGGTVTGEHGVGVEKLNAMCRQFNTAELNQFYRLKAAFDPDSLLNPGKAIPTLRRCAEMGAMHVHRGRLPHPDLPRF